MSVKRAFLLMGAALAFGCSYPKYATFSSPQGDYRCLVPYQWHFRAEADGPDFTNAVFVGPFEPEFYLGMPSLSVRWHRAYKIHRLPDGSSEAYADADDYIRQTLDLVYGPDPIMKKEVSEVEVSGRPAKHFIVKSPRKVSKKQRFGVGSDKQGNPVNLRQHAYVVVPAKDGFYVLIYPATINGYPKYEKAFNQLVNSFRILKEGPGGPDVNKAAAAK